MVRNYEFIDFVGCQYEGEEEKKSILESYNEYEYNKIIFLNECYDNVNTITTYWTLYKTNIKQYEDGYNKDLMYFSTEEIQSMIESFVYSYNTSRNNITSFVNNYCRWAEKRRYINTNPVTGIDMDNINKNSELFLENKIIGKREFKKIIAKMELNTDIQNILPLILARYGITGFWLYNMTHLKWEDINFDDKNVVIKNKCGEIVSILLVDDWFLNQINKIQYKFGYILQKTKEGKGKGDIIQRNTVFNRVNECCTAINIKRIPFKELVMSRQLEYLLDIRKDKRLEFSDVESIVRLFDFEKTENVLNKTFRLKKRYEDLTGDIVKTARKDTKVLTDERSSEIAKKIQDRFDLYL